MANKRPAPFPQPWRQHGDQGCAAPERQPERSKAAAVPLSADAPKGAPRRQGARASAHADNKAAPTRKPPFPDLLRENAQQRKAVAPESLWADAPQADSAGAQPQGRLRQPRFVPMSAEEMRALGWDQLDVLLINGDSGEVPGMLLL